MIERIDVLKGGQGIFYGTRSVGGVTHRTDIRNVVANGIVTGNLRNRVGKRLHCGGSS